MEKHYKNHYNVYSLDDIGNEIVDAETYQGSPTWSSESKPWSQNLVEQTWVDRPAPGNIDTVINGVFTEPDTLKSPVEEVRLGQGTYQGFDAVPATIDTGAWIPQTSTSPPLKPTFGK